MVDPSPSSSTPTTRGYRLHDRQKEVLKLLAGNQRHTLVYGGSRSGKTFLLVRAVLVRAIRFPESRHAILRFRKNAVINSVYLDTFRKVLRLCFPQIATTPHKQEGYISLPNGSEIWFGGLDDDEAVEKILGNEYLTIYLNECSQIPYSSVLMALTRLAQSVSSATQRCYYDLNPTGTGHWTYKTFVQKVDPVSDKPLPDPDDYAFTWMNPDDNRENLDPAYVRSLDALPEKQRRRFKDGQYVADVDGALWTLPQLERCRLDPGEELPPMRRVVVAVDPSGSKGKEDERSDEIGIIAAGLGQDDKAYVLGDYSGRYSPEQWGQKACVVALDHGADCIVGEQNYGGDMVRAIVQGQRNATDHWRFKLVTATRGKVVRAEPVAGYYEKNLVRHAARFPKLEEQMSNFSQSGYTGLKSPDRADALVWAITELMLSTAGAPRVTRI
jgi:Phage terminase large subunit/Terminase RNaseH-like domain